MRLAHLADLHLGFRQYHRQTPQGINQREADVALAFRHAIDDIIAAKPDIVLIAGDLFQSVRPPNPAILDAFNQFRRLRTGLPKTPLIITAGNHDTPRSTETGTILKLFEAIEGVFVAHHEPRRLTFDDLDLAVLCVPHVAWSFSPRPAIDCDEKYRWNVLVTHEPVAGVIPEDRMNLEYGGVPIEVSDLRPDRFSYVALGNYHVAHAVAPNAWYSGALEYVSPNPWGELQAEASSGRGVGKGWILVELGARRRVSVQKVSLARRLIDLEPIRGAGKTAQELSALIAERVAKVRGGIDDQIVRQVVYDVPRTVSRDIDHERVRRYKAQALHYLLDMRRPAPAQDVGVGGPGVRQTLPELVTDYLSRRPLDAGIDRDRLVALGKAYMEAVEAEGQ